jgi:hypothetical protein
MVPRSHGKGNIMRKKQEKVRGAGHAIRFPTTGRVFANGTAIEPLRDLTNPERLCLAYWDGMRATIGSEVKCGGQTFAPAPIDPTVLRALTLPTRIAPYGSARKLLEDMSAVVTEYTGLPENSVAAMSRWALSNWFPEMRPAPGLSVIGLDTTAGRQVFELLHSLCRHALLLTEMNAAGLRSLPMEWGLTLLIPEPVLSADVQRILSGARRGIGFIPRGGRLLDFHCAVATCSEFVGACGPGVMPSLEISLVPAHEGLPVLDSEMQQKIASDFQPKLLSYRLENYTRVRNAAFDAPRLTPSLRELVKNLAACTPDDPDLQAQVLEFLRAQDQETRSAGWLDLNVVIVEAILAFVHEAKEDSVYVAEITKAAETILRGRGENRNLEARAIGPRLRPLGLITEPRDRNGIRLVLTGEVSRRAHELAHSFSVPSIQDGLKRCDRCK